MAKRKKHHKRHITADDNTFDLSKIPQILSSIDIDKISSLIDVVEDSKATAEQIGDKQKNRESVIEAIRTLINSDKFELLKIFLELYRASQKK